MQRLQVQLILGLLADEFQVRAQRRLGDTFGIVVVVLLSLHEGLRVLSWNDPWLEIQFAQRTTDKVRAEARLHANYAARQLLERHNQCETFDLASQDDLAVRIEADDVKKSLPMSTPTTESSVGVLLDDLGMGWCSFICR